MARQSIRISQMVLTFGPGAILETRSGPRVILRKGLSMPPGMSLRDLEISSPELQALLTHMTGQDDEDPSAIRIFHIPSSAMVENRAWQTKAFPQWKLCVRHQILYRRECPRCVAEGRKKYRHEQEREAIRFVLACPAGHLDDVDWDAVVHRRSRRCRSDYYLWKQNGSSLADIQIECPKCHTSVALGWAYGQPWSCSGRFPEREERDSPPERPGCSEQAYILQRQASNLRVPEVFSLLTIPPPFTRLHQILQKPSVRNVLIPGVVITAAGELNRENLKSVLNHLVNRRSISQQEVTEILQCPDDEIATAIQAVLEYKPPSDFISLLRQEFRSFLDGASHGIPPVHAPRPRSRVLLEINPHDIRIFPPFRVVPVRRLRVVTVQVGYRRSVGRLEEGSLQGQVVDVSITDHEGNRWYPGFESMGEGLFITLEDPEEWQDRPDGKASQRWLNAMYSGRYDDRLFRISRDIEMDPAFVAWHTLSHLLIRAVGVDSGYAAPSIRERVYLEKNQKSQVRGGILLYTATRSGDGALGGLLALAPVFDRVLQRAEGFARTCSADPLCYEHTFREGEVLGAACHGCCLISETSCEHRNFWLDRHVLLEMGWF